MTSKGFRGDKPLAAASGNEVVTTAPGAPSLNGHRVPLAETQMRWRRPVPTSDNVRKSAQPDETIDVLDFEEPELLSEVVIDPTNALANFRSALLKLGYPRDTAEAATTAAKYALDETSEQPFEQSSENVVTESKFDVLRADDERRKAAILGAAQPKPGRPPMPVEEVERLAKIVSGEIAGTKEQRKAARDRLNSAKRRLKLVPPKA